VSRVDVAVVGGGSAGSLAAAMLGRAGVSTLLVDIHETYPQEFRCEKIHDDQVDVLRETGIADPILADATPIEEMWVARRGHLIGKMQHSDRPWEYGCAYEELVASFRRQIPDNVNFITGNVASLKTGIEEQTITLSNDETWTARLVVLATGPSQKLARYQQIRHSEVSKSHSISIGFDIAKKGGFEFPALTYFSDMAGPTGYISVFPINSRMRLNWFLFHGIRGPWVQQARATPLPVLFGEMPRLKRFLEGAEIVTPIYFRPVDLQVAKDYMRPGVVLVGDSFATSCPSAGTGLNKVLTDVVRLCHHIPGWLTTPGMGVEKLSAYYKDPAKVACDKRSMQTSFYQRSLAIDNRLAWRARRWMWMGIDIRDGIRSRIRGRKRSAMPIAQTLPQNV